MGGETKRKVDLHEAAENALKTEGGDVTHSVYRAMSRSGMEKDRRKTEIHERPDDFEVGHLRDTIKMPGGMRRAHLVRHTTQPQLSDILMKFAGEDLYDDSQEEPATPLIVRLSSEKLTTDKQAFFTMLKAIVGSGVLFLPKAFVDGGSIFSCVFEVVIASLTAYCVVLLLTSRELVGGGALSFADLGERALGPLGRVAVQGSLISFQLGLVVSYFIFVTDTLGALLADFSNCSLLLNPTVGICLHAVLQLPIACLRNLRSLTLAATVADFCIVAGLFLVVCSCLFVIYTNGIQKVNYFSPSTAPLFVGTSVLSFEGVACMVPIKDCMHNPENFTSVLTTATIVVCFLYVSVGILGLMAFGNSVEQNVLLSIGAHGTVSHVVSALYVVAIACSLPLQAFPAYRVIEKMLGIQSGKYNDTAKWTKNILRGTVLIVLAAVATVGRRYLHYIVAIIGGLAGVPMGFVLPALIHDKITGSSPVIDKAIAFSGIFMSFFITAVTLQDWFTSHEQDPVPCIPV